MSIGNLQASNAASVLTSADTSHCIGLFLTVAGMRLSCAINLPELVGIAAKVDAKKVVTITATAISISLGDAGPKTVNFLGYSDITDVDVFSIAIESSGDLPLSGI